ncbi:MAG: heme ABC transporter ATP-binding protein [Acidimicrobiia bacterium]|nr:heme ABC transporter ATP-binding protein [Acidimicrobiia bacterium]
MSVTITIESVGYRAGGRTLLSDVNLVVAGGEVLGIVGPNGAGKTTLLRIVAGDVHPTSGRATINDRDTASTKAQELSQLRAFLGPQGVSENPFTVRDVVAMGRHPYRRAQIDLKDHDLIVELAMERTDVAHLAGRPISSLSTGERQRVGLARVLAQDTPVMLLDEPTSALDIGHQESVMRIMRAAADQGSAVVAVLHDLNLAAAHADRLVLLDCGRVQVAGAPADVLTDDILTEVYRQPMRVIPHPDRDCSLVLTLEDE